jgi:hypothetical protein
MKEGLELERLIEAEQEAAPSAERVSQGWQRLSDTVAAGAPAPLPVPVDGPLALKAAGLTAKGMTVLALVGATTLGGGGWLAASMLHDDSPPEPRPAAATEPAAAQAGTRAAEVAPGEAEPEVAEPRPAPKAVGSSQLSSPGRAGKAGLAAASSGADARVPERSAGGFDEELALIKQAKAALDSGRAQAGLAALNEHARRYPRGVFAGEREALRVLAACGGGPSEYGRRAARRFLRSHPGSPMVDRIRRACDLDVADHRP